MKKFTKVCLVFASILVGIGLLLAVIGSVLGFRAENIFDLNSIINEINVAEENFEFSTNEIEKLNINVSAGSLNINTTKEDKIRIKVRAGEGTYNCYQEDNELVMKEKNNRIFWRLFGNYGAEVTVYIPENIQLEDGTIQLGAGEAIVEGLNGKTLSFDVGAGSFQGKEITAKEKLNLSVGAGEIKINQMKAGETVVDCGVGSIYLEGEIKGNVSADCGIGEIIFSIDGKEDDFNYQVENGIGSISINSNEYESIATNKIIDNNADKTFDLECGVGSIEINTD